MKILIIVGFVAVFFFHHAEAIKQYKKFCHDLLGYIKASTWKLSEAEVQKLGESAMPGIESSATGGHEAPSMLELGIPPTTDWYGADSFGSPDEIATAWLAVEHKINLGSLHSFNFLGEPYSPDVAHKRGIGEPETGGPEEKHYDGMSLKLSWFQSGESLSKAEGRHLFARLDFSNRKGTQAETLLWQLKKVVDRPKFPFNEFRKACRPFFAPYDLKDHRGFLVLHSQHKGDDDFPRGVIDTVGITHEIKKRDANFPFVNFHGAKRDFFLEEEFEYPPGKGNYVPTSYLHSAIASSFYLGGPDAQRLQAPPDDQPGDHRRGPPHGRPRSGGFGSPSSPKRPGSPLRSGALEPHSE